MRIRSQGSFQQTGGTWNYSNCTPAIVSSSTASSESFFSGDTKVTTDVVTPNFRKRQARGEVIINPFSSISTKKSGSLCYWEYGNTHPCSGKPTTFEKWWGTGRGGTNSVYPSWPDVANAKVIAGTAAMAAVEEAPVQGLVELAEIGKTFRMLRRPLAELHAFLDHVRSSKNRTFKSRSAALGTYLSSEYLKYRYGLMPLVRTLDTVLTKVGQVRVSQRRTARGSSSARFSSYNQGDQFSLNSLYDYKETTEIVSTASVRAGVLYEHVFDPNYKYGLRLSDVPPAAWELIPYSFVADWFVNVGDWIQAVTPKAGVRILGTWTTVVYDGYGIYTGTCIPKTYPNTYIHASGANVQRIQTVIKQREPGISIGLASKIHEINFEKSKDWIHAADSLALIAQRLLRA